MQFLYSLTHPDIFGSSQSLKYFLFACGVLCTQVCRDSRRKVYAFFLTSFLASTGFFIFFYNLLLSLIIVPHSLVMRILPSAPMSTPQHCGNRSCIHGETSTYFPFCIWFLLHIWFSAWDTICHLAAMLSVCSLIAKARWCSWGHTQSHTEPVQQGVLIEALLQILVWLFTHAVTYIVIYCHILSYMSWQTYIVMNWNEMCFISTDLNINNTNDYIWASHSRLPT